MSPGDLQFLPFDRAPLQLAADWLLREYGPGTARDGDLSGLVVVLPGARASRALLEALAAQMPGGWQPPDLVTTGKLTDRFLKLERPRAPRLVRTLAWEKALRELGQGDLRALLSRRPAPEDNRAWLQLADEVREVFGKLSAECLDFHHVSSGAMATRGEGEQRRWRALAKAQDSAEAYLQEVGMCDPHRGRREVLDRGDILEPHREVVLVGVLEANELVRRLVGALEHVRALVFAPDGAREAFDGMGCLRSATWLKRPWALPLESWRMAMGPDDQARGVLEVIAGWKGAYSAEQITVGLGDSEVVPFLERRFSDQGVRAHDAKGIDDSVTPPARLLRGLLSFLRRPRFSALSSLVRHPDVEGYLEEKLDLGEYSCAQLLDEYHRDHLPGSIPPPWLPALKDRDARRNHLAEQVGEAVHDWLAVLGGRPRPLREWADPLREVLNEIYGRRSFDLSGGEDYLTRMGLQGLAGPLGDLEELPETADTPRTSVEALELVLSEAAEGHIQAAEPEPGTPTVELLGWLELAFDEAPALVVTGFNETFIPKSVTADRYLPDSLRRELGLPDDESRLGRDLFTLQWITESRQEVVLFSGRHNLNGDPLRPSRLAFRGSDPEVLMGVRRFLKEEGEAAPQPSLLLSDRELPLPAGLSEPRRWSATAISAYLKSPYLFALNHLARFRTLDDRDREMNPLVFGILGHKVLCRFASSPLVASTDSEAIARWLESALDAECARRFGSSPLPAVQLQCRQLAWRLGLFARVQAARASKGWRIEHAEWKPTQEVTLSVDGAEVPLTGSIDRIDRHTSGRWAILDYKFSDSPTTPEKAHQRAGSWQNVQLPLYAHLARELIGQEMPELGYFNLSATEADCKIEVAKKWDEGTVDDALNVSCDVIRDVRAQLGKASPDFPLGKPVAYDLITANVCGDTLLSYPSGGGEE
jgi:ATP-dependent helicase/nuclease subunit B